jgi:hypothetical protein
MSNQEKPSSQSGQLPERKQTTLDLYANPAQAYEMWKADLERVNIIYVRTHEEYGFIGYPDSAWNVPFAFVTFHRKDGITEYGPKMNPDFVAGVKNIACSCNRFRITW